MLRMILVLQIFQGADPKFCLPSTTYPTRSRSQKQLEQLLCIVKKRVIFFKSKPTNPSFSFDSLRWLSLIISFVFFVTSVLSVLFDKVLKQIKNADIRGGYLRESLVGVCRPVLRILTLFQTKKCNFPHPFSDQTSKIHTRFQIWPLGRNYVIIIQIRAQTQKLFKSIWNSHTVFLFLSYSFVIETIKMFTHSRSSLENPTPFQTQMDKVCTRFQTKTKQKPYAMGRHIPVWLIYLHGFRPLQPAYVKPLHPQTCNAGITHINFFFCTSLE